MDFVWRAIRLLRIFGVARNLEYGPSVDASKTVRRPLAVREVRPARGRNPGSFDSADSAQDDTKKDSARYSGVARNSKFLDPHSSHRRRCVGLSMTGRCHWHAAGIRGPSTPQTPLRMTQRRTSGRDEQRRTSGRDEQRRTSGRDEQRRTSGRDEQRRTSGRDDTRKESGRDDTKKDSALTPTRRARSMTQWRTRSG